MNLRELWSGAKVRYQKGGLLSVSKNAGIYLFGSAVVRVVSGGYSNVLLDPPEFRRKYSRDCFWELDDDINQVSKQLCLTLKPLPDDDSLDFQFSPIFEFRTPFVAQIEDVHLVGPHATVITSEGTVTGDSVSDQRDRLRWMLNSAIVSFPYRMSGYLRGKSTRRCDRVVPVGAVLYHQTGNYYHWVMENLLKLRHIGHYEAQTGKSVTLVLPSHTPSYVYDILRLFGYDTDQCLIWDGEPTKIETFIAPSFPEPTPASIEWLRSTSTDSIDREIESPKRLFISRQNSSKGRAIENYEEIREVLSEYDIEPVLCEEMSIQDQIAAFNNADLIVGVHGAGLTNMVWSDATTVVEIFNNYVKNQFCVLANLMDHEYSAISGVPVDDGRYEKNKNIVLNPHRMDTLLASVFD